MNALAIRNEMNLEDLQTLGQVFVQSKFFTDTTQAAQAIVKVMAGRELGFPEIASMTGVFIIKGKVSLSANLMAAAIKKSVKYNYRIRQHDDNGCKIEFFEDSESVGFSEFTRKDAEKAGLIGGDNWKKFFRNMCFARAMSNGFKWYAPDLSAGMPLYIPEELGATVDGETGEVIDLPVEPTREPEPEPTTVEAEPEPIAEAPPQPADVSRERLDAMADLRLLNVKLGYDDKSLLKWLKKRFVLNEDMQINDALFSLGDGELSQAIDTFTQHVEAAESKKKGATQ